MEVFGECYLSIKLNSTNLYLEWCLRTFLENINHVSTFLFIKEPKDVGPDSIYSH